MKATQKDKIKHAKNEILERIWNPCDAYKEALKKTTDDLNLDDKVFEEIIQDLLDDDLITDDSTTVYSHDKQKKHTIKKFILTEKGKKHIKKIL